jgi:thioredoxin 1
MSNRSIGFIGGGRITRIFLEGWTRAGKLPASITVSDPNTETLTKLKTRFPAITTTPDNAQAAGGEIVFLAVHPPVMAEVAPILEDLKKEYAGRMEVEFIDVWKNPDAGKAYGVEMIPTQIFYDAGGKELDRHTGFFGREDILAKWKELGVNLKPETGNPKPEGSQTSSGEKTENN